MAAADSSIVPTILVSCLNCSKFIMHRPTHIMGHVLSCDPVRCSSVGRASALPSTRIIILKRCLCSLTNISTLPLLTAPLLFTRFARHSPLVVTPSLYPFYFYSSFTTGLFNPPHPHSGILPRHLALIRLHLHPPGPTHPLRSLPFPYLLLFGPSPVRLPSSVSAPLLTFSLLLAPPSPPTCLTPLTPTP